MIPVGDFLRRRTTPYVNWTLIAANIAVFVYMLTMNTRPDEILGALDTSEADRFLLDWGFVPACIADTLRIGTDADPDALAELCRSDGKGFTQLFTTMFVHGGWAHIAGNMLFLWIFGDNVEDRMGHARYLAFYSLCGFAAGLTETVMAPDTAVPAVGASGAIAGVLGAYLVLAPTAMVQVVVLPFIFLPFFVPAVLLIGFWFVTQLFAGLAEVGSHSTVGAGVAWWAHVGGFVAGVVLIWPFKRRRRPERGAAVSF